MQKQVQDSLPTYFKGLKILLILLQHTMLQTIPYAIELPSNSTDKNYTIQNVCGDSVRGAKWRVRKRQITQFICGSQCSLQSVFVIFLIEEAKSIKSPTIASLYHLIHPELSNSFSFKILWPVQTFLSSPYSK